MVLWFVRKDRNQFTAGERLREAADILEAACFGVAVLNRNIALLDLGIIGNLLIVVLEVFLDTQVESTRSFYEETQQNVWPLRAVLLFAKSKGLHISIVESDYS
ncbi:hypothetical protein TIFTF001_030673 [Ficus carica]|uniref:Uncharacterized protein n=1 Tax=Ficus carica TaxID=3494 RepID=A0AA88J447_FICCA|nr:hypothetical protein TIFTF001_030673 [Ficus carica]